MLDFDFKDFKDKIPKEYEDAMSYFCFSTPISIAAIQLALVEKGIVKSTEELSKLQKIVWKKMREEFIKALEREKYS